MTNEPSLQLRYRLPIAIFRRIRRHIHAMIGTINAQPIADKQPGSVSLAGMEGTVDGDFVEFKLSWFPSPNDTEFLRANHTKLISILDRRSV